MTDTRHDDPRHRDGHSTDVSDDLRALRDATARDLPRLAHSVSAVRSRRLGAALTWRERLMSSAGNLGSRPWLASGAVAIALAVAMLVIPMSYERTTGHHVALTLSDAGGASQLRSIAAELKSALHVDQVMVKAEEANGAPTFTLEASVPASSRVNAAVVARAFAKGLNERGYAASAVTTAVRERVSGSVYAYARDLVIQVSTDGKSAAQIESEIRQRLADAGVTDAQVSVTDEGVNQRKVTLEVQRTADGSQAPSEPPSDITLQLTKDGRAMTGPEVSVRMKKTRTAAGVSLHLDVTDSGKSASIDVANSDSMSDAAIQSAIETQLARAGLDLRVTVTNGSVEIQRKP